MNFSEQLNYADSAHCLIVSPNVEGFLDNESNIYVIDRKNPKAKVEPQVISSPVTHKYTRSNSSSVDGNRLCVYIDKRKKTFLYQFNLVKKDFVGAKELSWSAGVTEVSRFSGDSKLLAVGGADGHVIVYDTKTAKPTLMLPKQSEYITAIEFSSTNKFIAYATFDKKMIVFDSVQGIITKVTTYDETIDVIAFLHKTNFIVYGARDNNLILFDIINGRTIRNLGSTISWPMKIYIDAHDQYAIVSDKAGYVHLLDLTSELGEVEPLFNADKVVVDIKALGDEEIWFLHEDGTIKILKIKEQIASLLEKVANQDIKEIYEEIAQNPLLRYSAKDVLAKNDEAYLEKLDSAMLQIVAGNKDKAKQVMGQTINSPLNRQKFEALLKHSDKVVNFWQMIDKADYAKAYDLANTSEFYKRLPFYDKMENRFCDAFTQALDVMAQTGKASEARAKLVQFAKIPQKAMGIKSMLESPEIFKKARLVFKRKDYKTLNNLLEKYKYLRHSPFFAKYEEIIQDKLNEFRGYFAQGDYTNSIKAMDFIKDNFESYATDLKEDFAKLEIVKNFNEDVINKRFASAMDLAAQNTFLVAAKEYKILDDMLTKRIDLATKYAFAKQFEPMDKLLRPFLKSKYSRNRAMGIYRIFYLEQIDELASKMKQQHWQHAIQSYVFRFGADEEITRIIQKYDQDRLLHEYKDFKEYDFLKYKAVKNIVTGAIIETNYATTKASARVQKPTQEDATKEQKAPSSDKDEKNT